MQGDRPAAAAAAATLSEARLPLWRTEGKAATAVRGGVGLEDARCGAGLAKAALKCGWGRWGAWGLSGPPPGGAAGWGREKKGKRPLEDSSEALVDLGGA